jgi:hypothetical protein
MPTTTAEKPEVKHPVQNRVLNETPSELIRLAVKCVKKAERAKKKYAVDMDHFHDYDAETKITTVCAAGAVAAYELGVNPKTSPCLPEFLEENQDSLKAIDCFMRGEIEEAFEQLQLGFPSILLRSNVDITHYEASPEEWKKEMLRLAEEFKLLRL